jgi:hypothetical protein
LTVLVAARHRRHGIEEPVVAAEIGAMSVVAVGKTTDRSVTGQMVDFAKHLTYYLPDNGWNEWDQHAAESRLAEMPCHASKPFDQVIFPQDAAPPAGGRVVRQSAAQ